MSNPNPPKSPSIESVGGLKPWVDLYGAKHSSEHVMRNFTTLHWLFTIGMKNPDIALLFGNSPSTIKAWRKLWKAL